jgi:hypothetical protein
MLRSCLVVVLMGAVVGLFFAVSDRRSMQVLGPGFDVALISLLVAMVSIGVGLFTGAIRSFVLVKRWFPAVAMGAMITVTASERLAPLLSYAIPGLASVRCNELSNFLICLIATAILQAPANLAFGIILACVIAKEASKWKKTLIWTACLGSLMISVRFGGDKLLPLKGTLSCAAVTLLLLLSVCFAIGGLAREWKLGVFGAVVLTGLSLCSLGRGLGSAYSYGMPSKYPKENSIGFDLLEDGDIRVMTSRGVPILEENGIEIGCVADRRGEIGLACFPRLLRPQAERTLVIGFGTGIASGMSLLFPDTDVVCFDSPRRIKTVDGAFSPWNHEPLKSRRFSIVSKLETADPASWDILLVNFADFRLQETARYATAKFYSRCRTMLNPEGIFAQRLNLRSLSSSDLSLLARTFSKSFPSCAYVRLSDFDGLLLGSPRQLIKSTDVPLAQDLLRSVPSLGEALRNTFETSDVTVLLASSMLLDHEGLKRLGNRGDKNNSVLWCGPIQLDSRRHIRWCLNEATSRVLGKRIVASTTLEFLAKSFIDLGGTAGQGSAFERLAGVFAAAGDREKAIRILRLGIEECPDSAEILVKQLLISFEAGSVDDIKLKKILEYPHHAVRLADLLFQQQLHREGINILEVLLTMNPKSALLWRKLERGYSIIGDRSQEKRCRLRLNELDPLETGHPQPPIRQGSMSMFPDAAHDHGSSSLQIF